MPFPSRSNQAAAQPAAAPAQSRFGQRPAAAPAQPAAAAPRTGFGGRPAAPPVRRSPFAGIESAEVREGRGDYVTDGNYVNKIVDIFLKDMRSGKQAVLVEMEVVVSSFDAADSSTHGCNKEGDKVTQFFHFGDSFLSNFKSFAKAAAGFDDAGQPMPDEEVTEAYCESLLSSEQGPTPLLNCFVYIEARTKPQQRDPSKTFTYVDFSPVKLNADGTPDLTSI